MQADYGIHGAKWFQGMEDAILSLRDLPFRGVLTPRLNARSILYGKRPHTYRIFYRVDENADVVFILHIRHCRQKPL